MLSFSCSDTNVRTRGRVGGCGQHIRIDKTFALRDLSHLYVHWFAKHWPIKSESMKFSSLTTRVDTVGKSRKEVFIELTSGEACRQLFRIHASYDGAQAAANHLAC